MAKGTGPVKSAKKAPAKDKKAKKADKMAKKANR